MCHSRSRSHEHDWAPSPEDCIPALPLLSTVPLTLSASSGTSFVCLLKKTQGFDLVQTHYRCGLIRSQAAGESREAVRGICQHYALLQRRPLPCRVSVPRQDHPGPRAEGGGGVYQIIRERRIHLEFLDFRFFSFYQCLGQTQELTSFCLHLVGSCDFQAGWWHLGIESPFPGRLLVFRFWCPPRPLQLSRFLWGGAI